MKKFKSDTLEYCQLKKFHRLILNDNNEFNFTTRKKRNNYRYAFLTDGEVVNRVLSLSDKLRQAYEFYQEIIFALKQHDAQYLTTVLMDQQQPTPQMFKARKVIKNVYPEIINSFEYGFSNSSAKCINNKIKVINRIFYGFGNFKNFRARILITCKKSFFAMNYKKATDSIFIESAPAA